MAKISNIFSSAIFLIVVSGLEGCASLPARQTPKIVEDGNRITGFGATYFKSLQTSDKHLGVFDIYLRLPLQEKCDVGLRISGYPPSYWYMLGIDMRYQVRSEYPLIAAGIGLGVDMSQGASVETTLVMGSEKIYGGIRLHYLALSSYYDANYRNSDDYSYNSDRFATDNSGRIYESGFIPGLFVGASIGSKYIILPEAGVVLGANGKAYLYGAISFQWMNDKERKARVIELPKQIELPKMESEKSSETIR